MPGGGENEVNYCELWGCILFTYVGHDYHIQCTYVAIVQKRDILHVLSCIRNIFAQVPCNITDGEMRTTPLLTLNLTGLTGDTQYCIHVSIAHFFLSLYIFNTCSYIYYKRTLFTAAVP